MCLRYRTGSTRTEVFMRGALAWASLVLATIVCSSATAQGFPTKPVRMIVPFGAGTTTDIVARIVAESLARSLGQPVIVDNRAGAGGVIGTDLAAKTAPDGYSIVMGTVGTHAINVGLYSKLPYDPIRDFAPIAFVGYTPLLLIVPANSSVKSPKDLAVLAQRPEGITFASAGNGTSGHLAGDLFAKLGGKMIHVPYKDGSQALTDLMSGNVDFMFYHPTAVVRWASAVQCALRWRRTSRRSRNRA
jgi:tripartite-type tricarboxylate transporter receptor subunit TctC